MEEMQRVSYGRNTELLCPQALPSPGTSPCSPLQELPKPSPLSFYEGFFYVGIIDYIINHWYQLNLQPLSIVLYLYKLPTPLRLNPINNIQERMFKRQSRAVVSIHPKAMLSLGTEMLFSSPSQSSVMILLTTYTG